MFKCEICDKEFDKESGLRGHKMGAHKTKKRQEPIESTTTLSSDEKAIADLVSADSEDWGPIREDELNDFSLMKNPLDLPPEAWTLQVEQKYAFRWCERKPDRVRQLTRAARRPLKWKIANATNLPELADLVDSLLGGVCVLDQILLFKPWHDHILVQNAKVDLADITDKSGTLEGRSMEISGDGIHAQASTRKMGTSQAPTVQEIGGSDVAMAEVADLGDLVTTE